MQQAKLKTNVTSSGRKVLSAQRVIDNDKKGSIENMLRIPVSPKL